jgi:hypothetical protein
MISIRATEVNLEIKKNSISNIIFIHYYSIWAPANFLRKYTKIACHTLMEDKKNLCTEYNRRE